jgi:uncharacterized protein YcbX
MHLAEIWRYPVKSMAGELLQSAGLTQAGISGDREIQVYNAAGRPITSRTHPALLGHRATIGPQGEVLVDSRPWTDPTVLADVQKIAGPGARLVRNTSLRRFDILPLLVATDGAIAAFGRDRRRLRPNLVIGGVEGLAERTWEGRQLAIGTTLIQIEDLRGRCVMTTYDPDTLVQDPEVLRDILRRFGGTLALNCDVIKGGALEVNQEVTLLAAHAG